MTIQIDAGDLSADEIIDALQSGERVVIRTEMLGNPHEITLRHDGEMFYCDTPTTLHRHENVDGMRQCIENMGYGASD